MNSRLTITFDPALSSMISLRASQENESNLPNFVSRLLRIALEKETTPTAATQTRKTIISDELQAFVGIAKPADKREWKERKEDCWA